jgi:hypothetical protein
MIYNVVAFGTIKKINQQTTAYRGLLVPDSIITQIRLRYDTFDKMLPEGADDGDVLRQQGQEQENAASKEMHPHLSMEELDPYESVARASVLRRESFIAEFAKSRGPPQIVIIIMLLALGFGSTIGVVSCSMQSKETM